MANENQQFEILTEVLERFHEKGILDKLTLIGSWCVYFYNIYFKEKVSSSELRTRDADFLLSKYEKFTQKTDIPALLEDLGFIVELRGQNGFMTLQHPELFVEFLVPEQGSETDKPFTIPSLSVKANKLNHLQMLLRDPITVKYHHLKVTVPNPADFAIHKLIISEIRKNKDKRKKDFLQGSDLYQYLVSNNGQSSIDTSIANLTTKEKKYLNKALDKIVIERPTKPVFVTNDKKYAIRRKLGKGDNWIVYQYYNPIEDSQTSKSGSLDDCKKHLFSLGYTPNRVLKI